MLTFHSAKVTLECLKYTKVLMNFRGLDLPSDKTDEADEVTKFTRQEMQSIA